MRESIIDVTSMNVNDYSPSLLREGESLVKIHSPTCGYCKELEPEWKNLEEYVSNTYDKYPISLISIEGGVVNKFNPDFEVNGYPTIVFLNKDGNVIEFKDDDRKFNNLKRFLEENMSQNGGGYKSKKYKSKKYKLKKYKSKKYKSKKYKSKKYKSKKYKSKKYK